MTASISPASPQPETRDYGRFAARFCLSTVSRMVRTATSRRTAIVLMLATVAAICLQLLVPQQRNVLPGEYAAWNARYGEVSNVLAMIGADRVTNTIWFKVIVLLLVRSVALSAVMNGWRLMRNGPAVRGPVRYRRFATEFANLNDVGHLLRKRGFRVFVGDDSLAAHRGLLANWGSVVFHFGLVMIVTGWIVTSHMAFTGYVELAPGQLLNSGNKTADGAGYLVTNSRNQPELTIFLERLEVERWPNGETKHVRAIVTASAPGKNDRRKIVTRNGPLSIGQTEFSLGSPMGTAALLVYRHPDGSEQTGYVNLPRTRSTVVPVIMTVPGTNVEMVIHEASDPLYPTGSVTVEFVDEYGIAQELHSGESGIVAGGELTFEAERTWALFMVQRDPGFPIIVFGGVMAIAGMAAALFIVPVTVTVRRSTGGWLIEQRGRLRGRDVVSPVLRAGSATGAMPVD